MTSWNRIVEQDEPFEVVVWPSVQSNTPPQSTSDAEGEGGGNAPTADVPTESREELSRRITAEISAKLEAETHRREKQQYSEGERAGRRQAEQASEARLKTAVSDVARAIQDFRSENEERLRRTQLETARLAVGIAERILKTRVENDPGVLAGMIASALEKARPHQVLRVRLRPEYGHLLRDCFGSLQMQDVNIVPDESLAAEGIVLETERGHLDLSVEAQLREVEAALGAYFQATE